MPKTAALRAAVFALSAKNRTGGVQTPPGPARVKAYKCILQSLSSRLGHNHQTHLVTIIPNQSKGNPLGDWSNFRQKLNIRICQQENDTFR